MERQLTTIANECRRIIQAAEADLGPLPKASYVDLCADNLPDVSILDIKSALVIAGVGF